MDHATSTSLIPVITPLTTLDSRDMTFVPDRRPESLYLVSKGVLVGFASDLLYIGDEASTMTRI
jgi:hypothetical protein